MLKTINIPTILLERNALKISFVYSHLSSLQLISIDLSETTRCWSCVIVTFASSSFSSASEKISHRTGSVCLTKTNYDVTSSGVYVGLYATCLLFFSDINQNQVLWQILVKVQNLKFYGASPSLNRVVLCKEWDRQADRRDDDANPRFL